MKKIRLSFALLIMTFLLSSCELFDHNDLESEDMTVSSYFDVMYDAYINERDTFCDTYLEENSDAFEECDFVYEEFLPNDLNDFNLVFDNAIILIENQDYTLQFEDIESNTLITVTLRFIEKNGSYLITDLNYTSSILQPVSEELLNQVKSSIETQLDAFTNSETFNNEICFTILSDMTEEKCNNNWLYMKNNNMHYEIEYMTVKENGIIELDVKGKMDTVTIFSLDILVSAHVFEDELIITYHTTTPTDQMDDDFFVLSNLLKSTFYENMSENEIKQFITMNDYEDMIRLHTLIEPYYNYGVSSNLEINTFVVTAYNAYEEMSITLRFKKGSTGLYYLQITDVKVDKKEFNEESFIEDFMNQVSHTTEVNTISNFYIDHSPTDLLELVGNDNEEILYDFYNYNNESYLLVYTTSIELLYRVEIKPTSEGHYIDFYLEDHNDYIPLSLVKNAFNDFLNQLDTDINNACSTYFKDSDSTCVALFEYVNAPSYSIFEINQLNEYYEFVLYYDSTYNNPLKIVIATSLDSGMVQFELVQSPIDIATVHIETNTILNSLNNNDTTIDDLINYFDSESSSTVLELYEFIKDNNYSISVTASSFSIFDNFIAFDIINDNENIIKSYIWELEYTLHSDTNIYQITDVKEISYDVTNDEIFSYLEAIGNDLVELRTSPKSLCIFYGDFLSSDKGCTSSSTYVANYFNSFYGALYQYNDLHILNVSIDAMSNRHLYTIHSDILLYLEDNTLHHKVVLSESNLPEQYEPYNYQDTRVYFQELLTKLVNSDIEQVDYYNNYNRVKNLFHFLNDETLYQEFTSVTHIETLEISDSYSIERFGFTYENGEVYYVDYKIAVSTYNVSQIEVTLLLQSTTKPELNSTNLLKYYNDSTAYDISVLEIPLSSSFNLKQIIETNHYHVSMIREDSNLLYLTVLDSNNITKFEITYAYSIEMSSFGMYYLKLETVEMTDTTYELLKTYCDDLESRDYSLIENYNELLSLTNLQEYFPEEFDNIYVNFNLRIRIDSNSLIIYYLEINYIIDHVPYSSSHQLHYDNDEIIWETKGYYVDNVSGTLVSADIAKTVIEEFFHDLQNPSISDEEIGLSYFHGLYVHNIITSRQELSSYSFEFSDITYIEDTNNPYYSIDMTITHMGETFEFPFYFQVLELEDGSHFIVLK